MDIERARKGERKTEEEATRHSGFASEKILSRLPPHSTGGIVRAVSAPSQDPRLGKRGSGWGESAGPGNRARSRWGEGAGCAAAFGAHRTWGAPRAEREAQSRQAKPRLGCSL